jgi:hypothetical protein
MNNIIYGDGVISDNTIVSGGPPLSIPASVAATAPFMPIVGSGIGGRPLVLAPAMLPPPA